MGRILVDYDADWPRKFEETAEALRSAGDPQWEIEHIGSTAIPGMRAKPIIDVAIRLRDDADDFERHRPRLESAGWRLGSSVRTHSVMLFESEGHRTRIAHFFEHGDWPTAHQRVLRDWLLSNAADVALYANAKEDAARRSDGRRSYNDAKSEIVQQIMDRARAARGLASVSVYDK